MNNPIYTGLLKDHLQNYVDLKRAMGHKFNHDASNLKRFDSFVLEKYPEDWPYKGNRIGLVQQKNLRGTGNPISPSLTHS